MTSNLLGALSNMDNKYHNEFKQLKNIGTGGFASVYRAQHKQSKQIYAIKKTKLSLKDTQANFREEFSRVLREAAYLKQIDHPNVLKLYDSWIQAVKTKRQENKIQNLNQMTTSQQDSISFIQSNDFPDYEYFLDDSIEDSQVEFELSTIQEEQVICDEQKQNKSKSESLQQQYKSEDEFIFRTYKEIEVYLQTELCKETLEDYIQRKNKQYFKAQKELTSNEFLKIKVKYLCEAFKIVNEIINGLSYIHEQFGLVHRDIKPSNIFLTKDDIIKIGDFGLCKVIQQYNILPATPTLSTQSSLQENQEYEEILSPLIIENLFKEECSLQNLYLDFTDLEDDSNITKNVGTKTYASPEQLSGDLEHFDQKSDIWSLGILLLQLFLPVQTIMEQNILIKDYKQGQLPIQFTKEFPEISAMMLRMIDLCVQNRPSSQELKNFFFKQSIQNIKSENDYEKKASNFVLSNDQTDMINNFQYKENSNYNNIKQDNVISLCLNTNNKVQYFKKYLQKKT